jgi:hypothetical protein
MASILDLPSELLEDILLPLSTESLSRLSRTCITLHTFLSPIIYHTIDWTWYDEDAHAPPFLLLLRTLLTNSGMAGKVKVLKLRGRGVTAEADWKAQPDIDWRPHPLSMTQSIGDTTHIPARTGMTGQEAKAERKRQLDGLSAKNDLLTAKLATKLEDDYLTKVAAAVDGIQIPGHPFSSWMQEFRRGNVDVFVALLLHKLPFLEKLDLGYGYLHLATFIPTMLHHLAFRHPTNLFFPNLACVTMAADAPHSPIGFWAHIDLTRPLFYLPNIQSIDADMAEPVIFAWPSPSLIPTLTSLSRLVLRKSTLMPKTLERLLSCTPALKHLHYEHVRSVGWRSPQWADYEIECPLPVFDRRHCGVCYCAPHRLKPEFIHCTHLDAALSHVASTLESLVLKITFDAEYTEQIDHPVTDAGYPRTLCGVIGHLGTLKSCTKLKEVEVPWCVLFGWEAEFPQKMQRWWTLDVVPHSNPEIDERFNWAAVLPLSSLTKLALRDDLSWFAHYGYSQRAIAALTRRLLFHSNNKLEKVGFRFSPDECDGEWNEPCGEKRTLAWREKTALLNAVCEEAAGGIECSIVRQRWKGRWGEGI